MVKRPKIVICPKCNKERIVGKSQYYNIINGKCKYCLSCEHLYFNNAKKQFSIYELKEHRKRYWSTRGCRIRRAWRHMHPMNVKVSRLKRQRLLKDLAIITVQRVYEDNIKKYGTLTCYLCEKPIQFGNDHLEHKIPVSRGGNSLYGNLGVACARCNGRKGIYTEQEYKLGV